MRRSAVTHGERPPTGSPAHHAVEAKKPSTRPNTTARLIAVAAKSIVVPAAWSWQTKSAPQSITQPRAPQSPAERQQCTPLQQMPWLQCAERQSAWTEQSPPSLRRIVRESFEACPAEFREESDMVNAEVRRALRKHIRKNYDRYPLILPVVQEI